MKSEPSTDWSRLLPRPASNDARRPPLVQALQDYDRLQRRRFHVPAHAGTSLLPEGWELLREPYRYDLTELDGLDVLSEPSGCLQEAQQQVARIFGVDRSFFLVNGASVGLMAAMLAVVKPGDEVLVPRNAHRSVLSGLILTGARPVWLLPERLPDWGLWGAVTPAQVEAALARHPNPAALFLTSPTYEGIGSDIEAIAELCRQRGLCLIVDEAHGSLWSLSDELPASACRFACDAVIHSLHKSGGSLTQSALAHLPKGSRIDPAVFQQALNTLQTTSPSYLLMANLEATVHYLRSPAGQDRIQQLVRQVTLLRHQLKDKLRAIRLFEPDSTRQFWDPGKLYFKNPAKSGEDWGAWLEAEHQIAYESASPEGVLYQAGLGLEPVDYEAFGQVMQAEDARLQAARQHLSMPSSPDHALPLIPEMAMLPRDAFFAPGERVSPENAVDRIAKETVVHCPPGVPVLFPGERIQAAHLPYLPQAGVLAVSLGVSRAPASPDTN